ncbi:MAG: hypothetical protein ABI761_14890 [Saprospiraceae bacterium]
MNSFDRNAEKDKTAALILTILIHVGLFVAIYFLGNTSQPTPSSPSGLSKPTTQIVQNRPKT